MEKVMLEMLQNVEDELELPSEKTFQKKLFIFFGLPGSGKTTLAREIKKRYPSVHISSDAIAIGQNLDLSDKYDWTFEIMNYLIDKYLGEGFNVIADCNADKYEIRKQLYDIASNRSAVP